MSTETIIHITPQQQQQQQRQHSRQPAGVVLTAPKVSQFETYVSKCLYTS